MPSTAVYLVAKPSAAARGPDDVLYTRLYSRTDLSSCLAWRWEAIGRPQAGQTAGSCLWQPVRRHGPRAPPAGAPPRSAPRWRQRCDREEGACFVRAMQHGLPALVLQRGHRAAAAAATCAPWTEPADAHAHAR
eukprot:scaffold1156_cov394-Prasinococcus_capsulatus_cf.AAC.1